MTCLTHKLTAKSRKKKVHYISSVIEPHVYAPDSDFPAQRDKLIGELRETLLQKKLLSGDSDQESERFESDSKESFVFDIPT